MRQTETGLIFWPGDNNSFSQMELCAQEHEGVPHRGLWAGSSVHPIILQLLVSHKCTTKTTTKNNPPPPKKKLCHYCTRSQAEFLLVCTYLQKSTRIRSLSSEPTDAGIQRVLCHYKINLSCVTVALQSHL